ncbi:hypothetical protein OTU49_005928, partial [Cherax quadricarinatus]
SSQFLIDTINVSPTLACFSSQDHPTVKAKAHLTQAGDAEALRKAMKGLGTDEDTIVDVLTSCNSDQRQLLYQQYNRAYDRDLTKDLKKELSGNLEDIIMALMTSHKDYLAQELHHACKKKNGRVIVEILCTADNSLIKSIKSSYERLFDTSLEESLTKATSDVFEEVMLKVVEAKRSALINEQLAHSIAKDLYNDGKDLDEAEVVKALSSYSYEELRSAFVEYYKLAGRTLGETFDSQYTGSTRTNMRALFDCLENRAEFFAQSFHKALAGPGTKDEDLIRLLVSRCEVDLGNIKEEYHKVYSKSLAEDVKADTSGAYRKAALALLD